MEGRMYSSPLRSVKWGVVALGIIMASLSITVLFPRPAHAEGFLSQTLRCTLEALMWKDCRAPQQPAAPIMPVAPQSPAPQPQQNQPSGPTDTQQSPGQVQPGQSGSVEPVQPVTIDPAEVEAAPLAVPDLPKPAHRQQFTYEPATYATHRYEIVKGEQTVAQAAVLEPSREGWRVLGLAWYWWGLGAALGAGVIIWVRRLKNKRMLSIAK